MDRLDHLGLTLAATRGPHPDQAIADRVRLVLGTRSGTLPYEPDFGCDLHGLIGRRLDRGHLMVIRKRVTDAITRWVPGVRVRRVEVTLDDLVAIRDGDPRVPTAERVMASAGLSAALRVAIVLETDHGTLELDADLHST